MFIKGRFTTLNKYIEAERTRNYHAAANIKKRETGLVTLQARNHKIKTPCKLKMTWYRKSKSGTNFDLDNVAFAKKFVLDGLVKANVIPNDNYTHIKGFIDEYVESKDEGVKIERVEE